MTVETFEESLIIACNRHYRQWTEDGGPSLASNAEAMVSSSKAATKNLLLQYNLYRNPHLARIAEIIDRKVTVKTGLICPSCEQGNYGNKKKRVPWCLVCNVPLMRPDKIKKLKNHIKVVTHESNRFTTGL